MISFPQPTWQSPNTDKDGAHIALVGLNVILKTL